MNPSTADLLAAVEACPADRVVILPNNKNIIPVAEQVDAQTAKAVRVVPTRGVSEGFAALLAYDPEADARRQRRRRWRRRPSSVVAGEVTRPCATPPPTPVRSPRATGSASPGGDRGRSTPTSARACCGLLDQLVADDHEIVTVIEGEGVRRGDTRRICEWLGEHRPDVEAEVHHGGQPLYPYLFGIE